MPQLSTNSHHYLKFTTPTHFKLTIATHSSAFHYVSFPVHYNHSLQFILLYTTTYTRLTSSQFSILTDSTSPHLKFTTSTHFRSLQLITPIHFTSFSLHKNHSPHFTSFTSLTSPHFKFTKPTHFTSSHFALIKFTTHSPHSFHFT